MATQKVRDIMTSQVITLSETDTLKAAVKKFALDNLTGAPVIDEGYRLIGMISENDILNYLIKLGNEHNPKGLPLFDGDNPDSVAIFGKITEKFDKTTVGDIMCRTVMTASPNTSVEELLNTMMEKDINRLPVLEKGVLVGIVTRGDIITLMQKRKF